MRPGQRAKGEGEVVPELMRCRGSLHIRLVLHADELLLTWFHALRDRVYHSLTQGTIIMPCLSHTILV